MNARYTIKGEVSPLPPARRPQAGLGSSVTPLYGALPRNAPSPPNSRCGRCAAAVLAVIGMALLGNAALYAQAGVTRFVNNTPFTVHIVAGSGRTEVCTLAPHSAGTGQGRFGQTEYFYPVFDVPLTAAFTLKDVRPADPNFFYQIDDRRGSEPIIIGSAPPLGDNAAYIVLVNTSRTGGVSVARTASSRLSRIDSGGDNVNAGERGVFRLNPGGNNEMRIASPVDAAFPSITHRPGYRYVCAFDGAAVTLVDARPLHTIGLPLNAALVFEGAVPEGERDSFRAALNDGLTAANAPLRVPAENVDGERGLQVSPESVDGGAAADNVGDTDDMRYVFVVTLTTAKRTIPFPANREMYTGEVTVTLFRNDGALAEHQTAVIAFNEAGVYRAARQFLAGDKQLYQTIAGAVKQ